MNRISVYITLDAVPQSVVGRKVVHRELETTSDGDVLVEKAEALAREAAQRAVEEDDDA